MSVVRLEKDPLVDDILEVFAREARVERTRLRPEARADSLGVSPVNLELTLCELEDRYEVELLAWDGLVLVPTVGEIVKRVVREVRAREADLIGRGNS